VQNIICSVCVDARLAGCTFTPATSLCCTVRMGEVATAFENPINFMRGSLHGQSSCSHRLNVPSNV